MAKLDKRRICLGVALAAIILLLLCELFKLSTLFPNDLSGAVKDSIDMAATRALGGIAFLAMLVNLEYKVLDPFRKPFFKALLYSLPAFLIAVNNFPFSLVIKGEAVLSRNGGEVLLLLFECMCVGFFEEMAFRGVVFLGLLKRKPQDRLWAFAAIALSSAVFGLVHLVNIFNSSPMAVLRQIGYSALIGAMCAVVLMKTANIWLCVIIHGLFNFCGAVIPVSVTEWDMLTVVITVVLSVLVLAYMVVLFIKDKMEALESVYKKK